MNAPLNTYVILDTIQAAHADLVLTNNQVSFGNPAQRVSLYKNLIPGKCYKTAAVAETSQVSTVTFTAAANTVYTLTITQQVLAYGIPLSGQLIQRTYSYTSAASGDTPTTIGDQFRTAINADPAIFVTASGTATLVLTADSGNPKFTVQNIVPSTTTNVVTTPGVVSKGKVANLIAAGVTGYTGTSYTQFHLEFYEDLADCNTQKSNNHIVWNAWINEGATHFAALNTYIGEFLSAYEAGATTADPEAIAVG